MDGTVSEATPGGNPGGPGTATPEPKSVAERLAEGRGNADLPLCCRPEDRAAVRWSEGNRDILILAHVLKWATGFIESYLDGHPAGKCDCPACRFGDYPGDLHYELTGTLFNVERAAGFLEDMAVGDLDVDTATWGGDLRKLADECDAVDDECEADAPTTAEDAAHV